jgi:peptide/nickel transport system permease protein
MREFFVRLVKEKPMGTVGGVIVLVLLLSGIFANILATEGINDIHPQDMLAAPSIHHPLGTDSLGRDMLSRIIYGARTSLIVGLSGSALGACIAVAIGLMSGFFGGAVDIITQRIVDGIMCFPWLVIVLTVMSVLGQGILQVILVLAIIAGVRDSRVIRSSVLGVKGNTYIEAVKAVGCSDIRIMTRHILPNIAAQIIVLFTVNMGYMILAESTISYLGFGIPPPTPSWGGMLSGAGTRHMIRAPWLAFWPGFALAIAVYGINMLGDAVRDIIDPRLRGGLGRYGRPLTQGKHVRLKGEGSKLGIVKNHKRE